jgi:hypothetical protein
VGYHLGYLLYLYLKPVRKYERFKVINTWVSRSIKIKEPIYYTPKVKKVKQSRYTPWRRLGGEEV